METPEEELSNLREWAQTRERTREGKKMAHNKHLPGTICPVCVGIEIAMDAIASAHRAPRATQPAIDNPADENEQDQWGIES